MRLRPLLLVPILVASALLAQDAPTVSPEQHAQHLTQLRDLVARCKTAAAECDSNRVGPDETLELRSDVDSKVRYDWLRSSLGKLKSANDTDRQHIADALLTRLNTAPAAPELAYDTARHNADIVLKDVEFAASKPSWFSTMWRKLQRWFDRHTSFDSPSAATRSLFRFLVEVFLFAIPLLLLIIWFVRQVREERLTPQSAGQTGKRNTHAQAEWMRLARERASAGDWREAIHALYWHSIAVFEEKRIWPVARNRTPREYLALLEPGSTRRKLLREQTQMLESIWYGYRSATERDFARALQLTEELARS